MSDWTRCNRHRPCPVCGRIKYCSVSANGEVCICTKIESPKRCGDAGWLHVLKETPRRWRPRQRRIAISLPREDGPDFGDLAEGLQRDAAVLGMIEPLARKLGVTAATLRRLTVGWNENGRFWTFPLRDPHQRVVGINRRFCNGDKRVMQGHHIGLYIPIDLPTNLDGQVLLICEGGSDTAAALDLGFWAIGRFSCSTCLQMLAELVCRTHPRTVVIVADADKPGRRGAEALASFLAPYCPTIRVVFPPNGTKDLRQWRQAGLTSGELRAAIEAAQPHKLNISARPLTKPGRRAPRGR